MQIYEAVVHFDEPLYITAHFMGQMKYQKLKQLRSKRWPSRIPFIKGISEARL